MRAADDYFARMSATRQELLRHGFDGWPTDEEALRYLLDTNDRLDAVCAALGVVAEKDFRGRWRVRRADAGEVA